MKNKALLIIDMQTGNFSDLDPIYKGDELLNKVKRLIEKAHSEKLLVIFIQNNGGVGDPDEYGTPGWAIHSSISPIKDDFIIQKHSPDSFYDTILHGELQNYNIEELYIAGLQTEVCIDTTCRRAFSLGYKITLVEDAHSTCDSSFLKAQQIIIHHNLVLGDWFVNLKKEEEIEF